MAAAAATAEAPRIAQVSLKRELLLFRRLELGLELLHHHGVLLGRLEQRRTPLVSLLLRRLPLRLLQRCSELVHLALTLSMSACC